MVIGIASAWFGSASKTARRPTVLVTDYDRTFTRPDLSLAEETLAAARAARDQGLVLVLATGRRLADLDMTTLKECFDAYVLEGGAMWGMPGDWTFAHVPDALWFACETLSLEGHAVSQGMASFSAPADLWHHPVLRASGMDVRRNRDRLDVTPAGVNKWTGVTSWLTRQNIPHGRLATVGDSENDLPLFTNANLAIAVQDSEAAVLQNAHVVAPGPADEGFRWALQQVGVTAA